MRLTAVGTILALALVGFAVAAQDSKGIRYTAISDNVSGSGEAVRINLTAWSSELQRDEFVAAWNLTGPTAGARGARGTRGAGGAPRGGGAARGGAANTAAAPRGAAASTDLPADPDAVPAPPALPSARGGAGGRGGTAALTPEASLAAALQKASTVGILWTSETVGYSIKYAWRIQEPDGGEHVILATDRRVGKWSDGWTPVSSAPASEYPFSIIELRLNSKGVGEGKGVVEGKVVIDGDAKAIVLDGYTALPVILKNVKRGS